MAENVLRGSGWQCALLKCSLLISVVAVFAAPVAGQTLSEQLLVDARDGRLNKLDFFAATLIASGVEDACELSGWLDFYAAKRSKLLVELSAGPQNERLRLLHAALHEQLLTGAYATAASDVRQSLAEGDFNCLSSVAIYYDLCGHARLDVQIWLTRGHVHLRGTADATFCIEPGATQWTENGWQSGGRQITPVELLGKFYYNRGVGLLQERRFAEGIELLQTALELDPGDDDARANLVAGLNNWAVDHFRAARYHEAAPLIEQGLRLDPAFAPLVANERLVLSKLGQ